MERCPINQGILTRRCLALSARSRLKTTIKSCLLFHFMDVYLDFLLSVQALCLMYARVYACKRYNSISVRTIHKTR